MKIFASKPRTFKKEGTHSPIKLNYPKCVASTLPKMCSIDIGKVN